MVNFKSIHVAANGSVSYFLRLSNIPVCVYHTFLNQSSLDGHLGCSHVLVSINSAATNIECMYLFKLEFSYFQNIFPGAG